MFSPAPCHPRAVPPSQLIILDSQQGAETTVATVVSTNSWENTVVGPYQEGNSFNITCLASGGIPAPRVSWWRGHALLDDSFEVLPDGTVKNVLFVSKLSRRDLFTVSFFAIAQENLYSFYSCAVFFSMHGVTSWHIIKLS